MALILPQRLACRPCRFTSNSAATSFSALRFAPFGTLSQEILERWKRRSNRLEGLLKRVKCPKVETFEANGHVYQLPVPAAMPGGQPSREELEYLCGNFDGDGCVSLSKSDGKMSLCVSQAIERAEILVRFRDALGGGIYRHIDATGFNAACLRWRTAGPAAQRAASILGSLPSMKQAQLQIAAEAAGGTVEATGRPIVAEKLKLLKEHTYAPVQGGLKCSWHYFSGFFDAEGSITVRADSAVLSLTVAQTNPFVLQHLLVFLELEGFHGWKLYQSGKGSILRCDRLEMAKSFLGQLLANGLALKKQQAEASMTLTTANHYEVRELVSKLNGLQGFYRRLDAAGIGKAKEIQKQRRKIRHLQEDNCAKNHSKTSLEVAQAELKYLEEQKALCKVISCCSKLQSQVRKLLHEGATIMPRLPN